MQKWKNEGKTHGGEPVIVDLEALVPEDHLLRKIERVIDYEWLYALLSPYYCHDNGRPGIDPVVLIKMVLIQHLFGIASLRQTYREILVNVAYDEVTRKFNEVKFVTMDAGYKTPWIAKKTIEDGRVPVLPYTRYTGRQDRYKPWEYTYDPANDTYTCPRGRILRHTTTDRDGKRTYRSTPEQCRNCPCKAKCGANEKGQKVHTTHIWQEYLDLVEQIRKTDRAKEIYAQRKETIERVFADAKERHAMRYTHHRGLAAVTRWVRLKFAAMNLKKLAVWSWKNSIFAFIFTCFCPNYEKTPAFAT